MMTSSETCHGVGVARLEPEDDVDDLRDVAPIEIHETRLLPVMA
jgi:hypothetical protein